VRTTFGNSRGQAMIEFALVLPILLLVVFGATEFGRAWMAMNVLTHAAREGCRIAVVTEPDIVAVNARITELCTASKVTPTNISVIGPDPLDPDRRVTVTVQTDFQVLSAKVLGTFSGIIPLQSTCVMRHESI
jgi:Flp pilus assembly protein TadG